MVTVFAPTFCEPLRAPRRARATAEEPGAAWSVEAQPQRDFWLSGGRSAIGMGRLRRPDRSLSFRLLPGADSRSAEPWSPSPSGRPHPMAQTRCGEEPGVAWVLEA